MKIYLFNPENGVYLGEDFADDASLKSGTYILPDDATTIPPPKVKPGEAPVFNLDTGSWEIKKVVRHKIGNSYILSLAISY